MTCYSGVDNLDHGLEVDHWDHGPEVDHWDHGLEVDHGPEVDRLD